jgi:PD-(D/E)XK nuclease superfamily protein
MDRGILLHEVFRRFYGESTPPQAPLYERDWARIEKIAEEELSTWRKKNPPRSEAAYQALRDDVLVACRIFMLGEETHCADVTPRWFEVGFGPSRETTEPPGHPDAVRIPLGGGSGFLLAGRIDRVDEEKTPGTYQVWDYKTGSSWDTADPERGRGGRRVQDALYAQALEILLQRAGQSGQVVKSGYFYAGRRGEGERFAAPLDPPATRQTLNDLFDLLRSGVFPHTPREEDCGICEYATVCGGVKVAAERAENKLRPEAGNDVLDPYRRLNP